MAKSWLTVTITSEAKDSRVSLSWETRRNHLEVSLEWERACNSKTLQYDDTFYYKPQRLGLKLRAKSAEDKVPIKDLSSFPIKYTSTELREQLERRGKTH